MQTMTCPTSEQLKAYLSGKVDDDSAVTLAQHLLDCPACESTAVELEKEPDTLVELLQTEKPSPGQPDDKPIAVLENQSAGSFNTLQMPQVLGQYRLLSRLGTGGMGAVYLAHHKSLDKQVAIKLLPTLPAQNSDFLARFQREMRAAGKLDHPAIVRTTDAGEQQGIHFLVMDAIDGMDLGRLLRIEDKLSIADACEVVRQAAIGLAHAHEKGIVHRDVKPSNLMLDANGQVRILDFGLAQIGFWESGSAEITTVGQLMGTLDYMAPEQAERGGAVDYRADLYSLGATLFRLLTGRAPLAAAPNLTPLEKLRLLATHRPPKLLSLRPDAPEPLSQIVDAMLAREPSGRPASAIHAAELLEPFGAGSDLVQLLRRVRSKPVPEESSFVLNPLLQRDLAEPLVLVVAPEVAANADAAPKTSESRSRWIPRWPTWLSLASCAALCFAGILFVLETSKGQLVIDSEADVSVKIVGVDDSGKRSDVEQLKIVPGTKTTRLRSGKYEISIDAASDSFGLTNGNFTIQNGQTIVATIKRTPSTIDVPTVANPAVAAPEDARLNEVVYDNEKLDTWLRRLKFERNPEEITRTLRAIQRLASKELRDLIHDPLVEFTLRDGTSAYHSSTIVALEKCCGETFPEALAKIMPGLKDGKIRTDFFRFSMTSIIESIYTISHDSSFLIESLRLLDDESSKDVLHAALTLRALVCELPNKKIESDVQQKILRKFANTSALTNRNFWLAYTPSEFRLIIPERYEKEFKNGPLMNQEIARRAMSALADASESASIKARASIILCELIRLKMEYSESQRTNLAKALALEISKATEDTRNCTELVELPFAFRDYSNPLPPGFTEGASIEPYFMVQMMNLIMALELKEELRPELEQFFQTLTDLPLYGKRIQSFAEANPKSGLVRAIEIAEQEENRNFLPIRVLFLQAGMLLGKTKNEMYSRFTQKLASDIQVEIDALLDFASKHLQLAESGWQTLPIEGNPRAVSVLESVVLGGQQSLGGKELAEVWMRAAGDEFPLSYARVLARANKAQKKALLSLVPYSSTYFQCTKPTALEPLLKWCDQSVAGKSMEDEQTKDCVSMLTRLLNNHDRISEECQEMIVDRLESYSFLNNDNLWLAQGIEVWGPVMRAAVLKRAFSIIAVEVESDDPLLCEALAIARQGLEYWDIVPEELRQKAIEQMLKRLDAAAREPSKHSHLQRVPINFDRLAMPVVVDRQPTNNGSETILSSNAIVQILNILVDMKVKSNAIPQKMTPTVEALHESIEKLNLMDANLSRSWTKEYWQRDRGGSKDQADRWVFHTWYMQSGSLLGKDFETLRLRPENLYREDQERKRRFIQPGDTLAIYVPGVLPESGDPPVIQAGTSTVVVGFPVPVSKDGTIQLRWLEPMKVQDLELSQVQEELLRQYSKHAQPNTLKGTTVQFLLRANRPQELRNLTGTGLAPPTK
jgi:serine/threonine protein kinase